MVMVQHRGDLGLLCFYDTVEAAALPSRVPSPVSTDGDGAAVEGCVDGGFQSYPPPPISTRSMTFTKVSALGNFLLSPSSEDDSFRLYELVGESDGEGEGEGDDEGTKAPNAWKVVFEPLKQDTRESSDPWKKRGMVTSLKIVSAVTLNRVLAAVGYEGGQLGLLLLSRSSASDKFAVEAAEYFRPASKVGAERGNTDPLLCLDSSKLSRRSFRIAAGFAGDNSEMSSKLTDREGGSRSKNKGKETDPGNKVGTVATLTVSIGDAPNYFDIEVHRMLRTCKLGENSFGKPGVNALGFNPSGNLLAVAGWDHRVRIFEGHGKKAAFLLKGHERAVRDIFWWDDSHLVSAGDDGRICVWEL